MDLETDQLAALIAKKLECLGQLRELGRWQLNLIATGDLTQLLKVLSGKQRLLGGLHEIERELDPFRDQSPEARVWRQPADRERCSKMSAACESLMGEIMQQEQQSESELRVHRDEAASRLQGTHAASQTTSAYLSNASGFSAQLDLSTER